MESFLSYIQIASVWEQNYSIHAYIHFPQSKYEENVNLKVYFKNKTIGSNWVVNLEQELHLRWIWKQHLDLQNNSHFNHNCILLYSGPFWVQLFKFCHQIWLWIRFWYQNYLIFMWKRTFSQPSTSHDSVAWRTTFSNNNVKYPFAAWPCQSLTSL